MHYTYKHSITIVCKMLTSSDYTAGADPGGHGGQKTPPSKFILGKPKEWCNGIKMHYFLSLTSFQYFMRYNPYMELHPPRLLLPFTPFKFKNFINLA